MAWSSFKQQTNTSYNFKLKEIATLKCRAKSDADANDICGSALWVCTSQKFADVTSKCTEEFYRCCNNVSACEYNKLNGF